MSKVGSVLLLIGEALLGGWCALAGLSFSAILLMGFIGTGGRARRPARYPARVHRRRLHDRLAPLPRRPATRARIRTSC